MPRHNKHHCNHSNDDQSYKHSVAHNEHHQVLGELKSIDRAVAKIVTLVEGLDEKIDTLHPALDRAPRSPSANAPPVQPLDPEY